MTIHKFCQSKTYLINGYLLFGDKWQFVLEITKEKTKDLLTCGNFVSADDKFNV
jgi:hypothetical protein